MQKLFAIVTCDPCGDDTDVSIEAVVSTTKEAIECIAASTAEGAKWIDITDMVAGACKKQEDNPFTQMPPQYDTPGTIREGNVKREYPGISDVDLNLLSVIRGKWNKPDGFTISKGNHVMELTDEEASELIDKLSEIFSADVRYNYHNVTNVKPLPDR